MSAALIPIMVTTNPSHRHILSPAVLYVVHGIANAKRGMYVQVDGVNELLEDSPRLAQLKVLSWAHIDGE